jgi:hypothetical protein
MSDNEKEVSSSSSSKMTGGGSSGEHNGPTGSCRTYPKKGSVPMKADFNPQVCKATDYATGGV